MPTASTPLSFNTQRDQNGTDITATVPTTTINLAENHTYYVSYTVRASFTTTENNRLITGLTLNSTFIPASAVAVEGTDYATATSAITVSTGASAGSLQLTVQVNGTATLEVAALNVIELL